MVQDANLQIKRNWDLDSTSGALLPVLSSILFGGVLSVIAAHIYAPLIAFKYTYVIIALFALFSMVKYRGNIHVTLLYLLLPFGMATAIASGFNYDFVDIVKYLLLFGFLSVLAKPQNFHYVVWMVRINLTILVMSILSFLFYESFLLYISEISSLIITPFAERTEWHYSLVNYITTIAQNDDENSPLGIRRMFGLSTEPTLFAIWCWCNFAIALLLQKQKAAFIFALGFVLAFSYGAIILVISSFIFKKTKQRFLLKSLFLLLLVGLVYYISISERGQLYFDLTLNWFFLQFENGDNGIADISVPYGFLSFISKKGLLPGLFYLLSCFLIVVHSQKVNASFVQKNLWLFVSVFLVSNKAGEPFGPFVVIFLAIWWQVLKRDKAVQF